ncbi:MAG: type VI secretion system tip protein VgrG [Gemmatimonadaceae bacterium]|nr:type VI secretion system tip protein VgrG [Gemmatimonadaceae bacterium]
MATTLGEVLDAVLPDFDVTSRPIVATSERMGSRLQVRSFACDEALSTPYEITLELLSRDGKVDAESMLRSRMSIEIAATVPGSQVRRFHGRVAAFQQLGRTDGNTAYRATLVPWLTLTGLSTDCRIFQREDVRAIVAKVFTDLGWSAGTDFEDRCTGQYQPRRFCVMYRESHLNFVSRLLEEEGIWYWFEHDGDREKLVLADANATAPEHPAALRVITQEARALDDEVLTAFYWQAGVHPGRVRLASYDFKQPSFQLRAQLEAETTEEIYDYQGAAHFVTPEHGEHFARVRLEEQAAARVLASGHGNVRGLAPGLRISVAGQRRAAGAESFLVTAVQHMASGGNLRSDDDPFQYENSLTVIPSATPYRAARRARKPVIHGTQTALVVGKAGEEIWTNEHAQVKLSFPWNHRCTRDENASCWVRVASPWAGKGWGGIHIPRIGQEVVVEFQEGDPDLPLVTGRVYNAENPPPYGLPANATQSGIKSRSSKGAGPANFNEIRFEDKKGSELVYFHAEKDEHSEVENDKQENVGRDEAITIGRDRTETVGKDETLTVVNNRTRNVGVNESVTVGMMRFHNVGVNEMINVGAAQEVSIGGFRMTNVGAYYMENIAAYMTTTVGGNKTTTVNGKILTEGKQEIHLVSGDSSITLKPDGTITIKGKTLITDTSGNTTMKAGGTIAKRASKITNNG